jgi:myo-inositol 2-dehydrogenase/D-chiro-inositol 1-dehydrogenase
MSSLTTAIIGCGRMGRERARCIAALNHRIAHVYDVDLERAAQLASQYNAQTVPEARACLDHVDAVFLCTAPGCRGGLDLAAISRGIPVYVEKPIAVSLDDAAPALEELRKRPVLSGVGYMNRYRRSVRLAREVLQSAAIIGFSAHWISRRYNVPWWTDPKQSGGPHNEQATHLFDLCRYLCGEIREVETFFNGNSQAATAMQLACGPPGTLFYSCDGAGKDIGIRVFTNKGTLALTGWDFRLTCNEIDNRLAVEGDEDIFLIETQSFLRGEVACDFHDAARTQALLDRANAHQNSNRERSQ